MAIGKRLERGNVLRPCDIQCRSQILEVSPNMPSRMQHFVMLIAIFSGAVLICCHLSAQKKVTKTSHPATVVPSYITVSGSTTPSGDATQQKNHCFKTAPASDLKLTITSTDLKNHPLPENGSVTVEIISLDLVDQERKRRISATGPASPMEAELRMAAITNGQAEVIFPGDSRTVHMGPSGPMSALSSISSPYSNLALITISGGGKEPMTYAYRYEIWKKLPSECAKKP